jgi:hypothetical protein
MGPCSSVLHIAAMGLNDRGLKAFDTNMWLICVKVKSMILRIENVT